MRLQSSYFSFTYLKEIYVETECREKYFKNTKYKVKVASQ